MLLEAEMPSKKYFWGYEVKHPTRILIYKHEIFPGGNQGPREYIMPVSSEDAAKAFLRDKLKEK